MARVLVLGGTAWLGGAVAATALAAGHDVTCLARGTAPVPSGARLVPADRDDPMAYAAVPTSGGWDLVVDVARQPGHARGAVRALGDHARHWAFVSSGSVYAHHDQVGADESAELLPALSSVASDAATPEEYGSGKVACEQAVLEARGGDALVARAGLIVGYGDRSDRFGYWPGRFALGAEDGEPVLVPARADQPVQWIDVADLARWLVQAGLAGAAGAFDAVGPVRTFQDLLDACAAATGFAGSLVAAADEALHAAGVQEFMGPRSLPLWLVDPQWQGFLARRGAAASAGLTARPVPDTVRDALAWEREQGLSRPRAGAGLDRADELGILASLAGRRS
ncbi:MAG TPA: NAD-dependent epimerase/dehydratase family protein [Intrasporangium sp.]|uniref:NAD-dependent epimerase/dehydratase family protein n=1 Tax=Intrasporangium sp. TaxID=1925024 RepID=UPI002D78716B|nr:NAD-dependent epimerase/dehydratase family protein [Intrasporangium sp.]HET7397107.1 NAD-dependent epimerase/dehydratase family protein [Intrasporangium sp.]